MPDRQGYVLPSEPWVDSELAVRFSVPPPTETWLGWYHSNSLLLPEFVQPLWLSSG